ncbi:unnamed protein product, partial [Diamesa hyperborea]
MFVQLSVDWSVAFSVLLEIFKFCGICPIQLQQNKKHKKKTETVNILLIVWSSFHLLLIAALTLFVFGEFSSTESSELASFNNVLKFSMMVLTHFVAILESVVMRKNFISVWEQMATVDDLIENMIENYSKMQKTFYKKTSRKIIFCIIFAIVFELIVIANVFKLEVWTFMWCASILPLMMSRMRHLQHTLYIDLLTCRFKVIKKELKAIVKLTKIESNLLIAKNTFYHDKLFSKLNTIKSTYNTLWESSLMINRSFGFSQLANLLQCFVQLTCDLYSIYSVLYKNNLTYILELLFQLFPTILIVIVVLNACEQCLEQVRYIGFLLHNIEKDIDDNKINTLTENFSLQILHEPVMFSVSGFFQMDFMFLKS